jgi:hypothetical protein
VLVNLGRDPGVNYKNGEMSSQTIAKRLHNINDVMVTIGVVYGAYPASSTSSPRGEPKCAGYVSRPLCHVVLSTPRGPPQVRISYDALPLPPLCCCLLDNNNIIFSTPSVQLQRPQNAVCILSNAVIPTCHNTRGLSVRDGGRPDRLKPTSRS